MRVNACQVCGASFGAHRKDRKWCTPGCKRELKRSYDRARYPSIAKETIARANAWQRSNVERKAKYDKDRRERLGEELKERKRLQDALSRERNPDLYRASASRSAANRRARELSAPVVAMSRGRVMKLTRPGHCSYCLRWVERPHLDHVIPLSRGGSHSEGNLLPACRSCNASKGSKTVMEWRISNVPLLPPHMRVYHSYGAGVAGINPFSGRERMWLGAPTVDPGSDWYRAIRGRDSLPGTLVFDVTEDGFDLSSLTII